MSYGINEHKNIPRKKHTPEAGSCEAAEGAGAKKCQASEGRFHLHSRQAHPKGSSTGKLLSPARRRACIVHVRQSLSISERLACAALGQHRSTLRKIPWDRDDEEQLTDDLVALVREHGRLGYRKMAALLRSASAWVRNDKRVEWIWRLEGLKVPPRQPSRSGIWPGEGACIRLGVERPNHVWPYDFVEDRTHDRRKYRMLNVVDEFMRESLSIRINK